MLTTLHSSSDKFRIKLSLVKERLDFEPSLHLIERPRVVDLIAQSGLFGCLKFYQSLSSIH